MASAAGRMAVDSSTVSRKRGAPVLIELLKNRPTRAERPVVYEPPPRAAAATSVEPKPVSIPGFASARSQNFWMLIAVGAALLVIISIAAYMFGSTRGESSAARKLLGNQPAPDMNQLQPPPVAPDPLNSTNPKAGNQDGQAGPSGGTPKPPVPAPAKALPRMKTPNGDFEVVFDDPDAGPTPGLNYMAVATLNYKDAYDAWDYLYLKKGMPCFLWPEPRKDASGKPIRVDPSSPAAKNGRWVVYVLKGAERPLSTEFRPTKDALERLIMDLGARWKQENRQAPTRFDQPHWVKWTN